MTCSEGSLCERCRADRAKAALKGEIGESALKSHAADLAMANAVGCSELFRNFQAPAKTACIRAGSLFVLHAEKEELVEQGLRTLGAAEAAIITFLGKKSGNGNSLGSLWKTSRGAQAQSVGDRLVEVAALPCARAEAEIAAEAKAASERAEARKVKAARDRRVYKRRTIPEGVIRILLTKQDGKCGMKWTGHGCRNSFPETPTRVLMDTDHIIPISFWSDHGLKGDVNHRFNLQLLCISCHGKKTRGDGIKCDKRVAERLERHNLHRKWRKLHHYARTGVIGAGGEPAAPACADRPAATAASTVTFDDVLAEEDGA